MQSEYSRKRHSENYKNLRGGCHVASIYIYLWNILIIKAIKKHIKKDYWNPQNDRIINRFTEHYYCVQLNSLYFEYYTIYNKERVRCIDRFNI